MAPTKSTIMTEQALTATSAGAEKSLIFEIIDLDTITNSLIGEIEFNSITTFKSRIRVTGTEACPVVFYLTSAGNGSVLTTGTFSDAYSTPEYMIQDRWNGSYANMVRIAAGFMKYNAETTKWEFQIELDLTKVLKAKIKADIKKSVTDRRELRLVVIFQNNNGITNPSTFTVDEQRRYEYNPVELPKTEGAML